VIETAIATLIATPIAIPTLIAAPIAALIAALIAIDGGQRQPCSNCPILRALCPLSEKPAEPTLLTSIKTLETLA
jgi:hypothetical protein